MQCGLPAVAAAGQPTARARRGPGSGRGPSGAWDGRVGLGATPGSDGAARTPLLPGGLEAGMAGGGSGSPGGAETASLGAVAATGPAGPGAQRGVNNLRTRACRGGRVGVTWPGGVRAPGELGRCRRWRRGLRARCSSGPRDRAAVAGVREGLGLRAAEATCAGGPAAHVFPGEAGQKGFRFQKQRLEACRTLRDSSQAGRRKAET